MKTTPAEALTQYEHHHHPLECQRHGGSSGGLPVGTARDHDVYDSRPDLGAVTHVRLHFAELYFSAAANREFDVAINGTTVLTNFDIYATAGANYTAVVEQYTATANSSGDIVIAFSNGAKDQPMVNGIEVLSTSTACSAVPSTPTNFTATALPRARSA